MALMKCISCWWITEGQRFSQMKSFVLSFAVSAAQPVSIRALFISKLGGMPMAGCTLDLSAQSLTLCYWASRMPITFRMLAASAGHAPKSAQSRFPLMTSLLSIGNEQ